MKIRIPLKERKKELSELDKMLIEEKIKEHYEPARIENFDEIITIDDFLKLFKKENTPNKKLLKAKLKELGFEKPESKMDDKYIVKSKILFV